MLGKINISIKRKNEMWINEKCCVFEMKVCVYNVWIIIYLKKNIYFK